MKLVEYRIPLPYTTEEYQIGQLYSFAVLSKEESGDGEGVEVIKNEPFEDENGKGQYTYKYAYILTHIFHHFQKLFHFRIPKSFHVVQNCCLLYDDDSLNNTP